MMSGRRSLVLKIVPRITRNIGIIFIDETECKSVLSHHIQPRSIFVNTVKHSISDFAGLSKIADIIRIYPFHFNVKGESKADNMTSVTMIHLRFQPCARQSLEDNSYNITHYKNSLQMKEHFKS